MDRALPTDESPADARDPLGAEIRHSALLIGGALGLMGLFAVLLLVVTTGFGG